MGSWRVLYWMGPQGTKHSENRKILVSNLKWCCSKVATSRGCLWKIQVWVLLALVQRLKGSEVSLSVLRYVNLATRGCHHPQKEASSKDDGQESPPKTLMKKSKLRTWITGNVCCGLTRPKLNTWAVTRLSVSSLQSSMLVGPKLNLRVGGGNQMMGAKMSVSCLESSMVVGVSWHRAKTTGIVFFQT